MNRKPKYDYSKPKSMWAVEEISDDDDKDIEEMQREVEDILSKITAKKRKAPNTNQVPMQVTVKVEVEKYNEPLPQSNKSSQNNQNKINITNNPNLLLNQSQKQDSTVRQGEYPILKKKEDSLSQTPPSTSGENTVLKPSPKNMVLKPSPKICQYENKLQNRSEETHNLINNTGKEITKKQKFNNDKYKHLTFRNDQIKDEMEKISMSSSNPVDMHIHMLAKNMANAPTAVTKNPQESAFEKVFLQWRDWYLKAPEIREAPSQYKCITCGVAWWHLSEFQEHLDTEHRTYNVYMTLKFQPAHHESYITAKKEGVPFKASRITTPCWRCGFTLDEKYKNYDVETQTYKCHCGSEHSTCTTYRLHLDVCVFNNLVANNKVIYKCHLCFLKFTSSAMLIKHKKVSHSVRSDLPCAWYKFVCKVCDIPLENFAWHDCPKMKQDISCSFCTKTFTATRFLNLHQNFVKDMVKCRYCDHILLKGCMELEHLIEHTENYTLMYECKVCEDKKFFLESNYYNIHLLTQHPSIDRAASVVPVPVKCIQMAGYTVPPRKIHKRHLDKTVDETAKSSIPRTKKYEIETIDLTSVKTYNKKVKAVTVTNKDLNPYESDNLHPNASVKDEYDNIEEYINSHKEIDEMILFRNKNIETIDEKEITQNLNDNRIDIHLAHETQEKEQGALDSVDIYKNIQIKEEIVEDTNVAEGNNILTNINDLINVNIKMEVKEEAVDEFYEDDIIILNEKSLGHLDVTDDPVNGDVKDDSSDTSEDEDDTDTNYDSESYYTNKKCYKSLHACRRCKFVGTFVMFKKHQQRYHSTKVPLKNITYTMEKNHNMECSRCKKKFKTLRAYLLHLNSHNYPKLTCPGCMEKHPYHKNLVAHTASEISRSIVRVRTIRKVDTDRTFRYQCKKCQKDVKASDFFQHWEKHLVMPGEKACTTNREQHAPETPHLRECIAFLLGATFANTAEPDSPLCKICNKKFVRRNDCKRHFIEHLLEDAYTNVVQNKGLKCQICGEVNTKHFNYKSHMRFHASLPVYKCELCNKSFSDASNFAKHKKVHNMSMFTCDICEKKFNVKLQLKKHLKIHETLNPIVCDVGECKRVCYTQSSYRRHYRQKHEKQNTQYRCPICKKKFASHKEKWDHQWTVHRQRKKDADCPLCKEPFRKVTDVKKHIQVAHSGQIHIYGKRAKRPRVE